MRARSPSPTSRRTRPEPDATAESEDAPPAPALSALLSQLAGLASRSLGGLKSLPIAQARRIAADPVRACFTCPDPRRRLGRDAGSRRRLSFAPRLTGDYAVDEFGFDPEFTDQDLSPCAASAGRRLVPRRGSRGRELPADGSALLVSNHAGTLPLDGMMLQTVVYRRDRPACPDARCGPGLQDCRTRMIFARKTGTTLACQEDAERLLALRPAGGGVPGRLQGPRQAVRRPLQTAAVRSRRIRRPPLFGRRCRSSRCRSSARRRSIRCFRGRRPWPGRWACRTSR